MAYTHDDINRAVTRIVTTAFKEEIEKGADYDDVMQIADGVMAAACVLFTENFLAPGRKVRRREVERLLEASNKNVTERVLIAFRRREQANDDKSKG